MPSNLAVQQSGQGPAGFTSVTAAIPASATTYTLTAPSASLAINNLSSTTILYVAFTGNATTSNFAVNPLQCLNYSGSPLASFSLIGSTASGSFSYLGY